MRFKIVVVTYIVFVERPVKKNHDYQLQDKISKIKQKCDEM